MAGKKQQQFYRAKQAFSVPHPDGGRNVVFGPDPVPRCLVEEGHWVLDGREDLFEPWDTDTAVEQATAAPGERRATVRPAAGDED